MARMAIAALGALLAVACAAPDAPPALSARGHFEVRGRQVPVAEVIAHLDADGDGGLSRGELEHESWGWLVAEAAAVLEDGLEAAGRGLAHLFERFDGDASGRLDAQEVEEAAAAAAAARGVSGGGAERQRLLLRARAAAAPPQAAGRRLDQVKDLQPDPRCLAPKGYPTDPEGWLCANTTAPIYCTGKKRAFAVEPCGWKGQCTAGPWLSGGCEYPLCNLGNSCYNDSHKLWCESVSAHGRNEVQPHVRQICGAGSACRIFNDGLPPTRRRRTTNCHEECHKSKCHQVCHDDPPDPPVTTCVREGCELLSVASPAYVRRCVREV